MLSEEAIEKICKRVWELVDGPISTVRDEFAMCTTDTYTKADVTRLCGSSSKGELVSCVLRHELELANLAAEV